MKTELTPGEIRRVVTHLKSMIGFDEEWLKDSPKKSKPHYRILFRIKMNKHLLSLLTKQDEQPQADNVDIATALDREMEKTEYFRKELQSLKQANAEQVEILRKTMMYRPPKDWRDGYNLAKAYLEKLDKQ